MERIEFPAAIAIYFLIALVLPALRAWRSQRVCILVFYREANPFARAIGMLFGLFLIALMTWAVLYWRLEPPTIGIWNAPPWVAALGWLLIAGGTVISVAAQRQMGGSLRIGIDDRPTDLVTNGLFTFCRNPIFAGMILTLVGMALVSPALWSILFVSITILLIAVQTRLEERHLAELHGETYIAYARKVGRFVPGVGRFPNAEVGLRNAEGE